MALMGHDGALMGPLYGHLDDIMYDILNGLTGHYNCKLGCGWQGQHIGQVADLEELPVQCHSCLAYCRTLVVCPSVMST